MDCVEENFDIVDDLLHVSYHKTQLHIHHNGYTLLIMEQ
jgi:hypothetical protein